MVICYLTSFFFFSLFFGVLFCRTSEASISSHLAEFWKAELFLERKHDTV